MPPRCRLSAPTTKSYRRLVPGYESPVNLVYSQATAPGCPHSHLLQDPESKRIEFRCPDPSCNPYLAFSAMLMAGLDGVQNKIDPGDPIDKDLYDLEPEEAEKVKSTPGSLGEVLDALEADHEFLLKGSVFTKDVIETWLTYKRNRELAPVNRARPVRSSSTSTCKPNRLPASLARAWFLPPTRAGVFALHMGRVSDQLRALAGIIIGFAWRLRNDRR